jgi:hypothetical protein
LARPFSARLGPARWRGELENQARLGLCRSSVKLGLARELGSSRHRICTF